MSVVTNKDFRAALVPDLTNGNGKTTKLIVTKDLGEDLTSGPWEAIV